MRKLTLAALAVLLLVTGYAAYPFMTAWSIREAVRTGDADYLEAKIEWNSVRATMRQSLAAAPFGLKGSDEGAANGIAPKVTLWRRFKSYLGAKAANGFVNSYVTPAGLPKLFAYGKLYRTHVAHEDDEALLPWHQRFVRFWSRLKRAEFHSPSRFEIEIADRYDASRHFVGLLELRGLEWKLTELRIRSLADAAPLERTAGG